MKEGKIEKQIESTLEEKNLSGYIQFSGEYTIY